MVHVPGEEEVLALQAGVPSLEDADHIRRARASLIAIRRPVRHGDAGQANRAPCPLGSQRHRIDAHHPSRLRVTNLRKRRPAHCIRRQPPDGHELRAQGPTEPVLPHRVRSVGDDEHAKGPGRASGVGRGILQSQAGGIGRGDDRDPGTSHVRSRERSQCIARSGEQHDRSGDHVVSRLPERQQVHVDPRAEPGRTGGAREFQDRPRRIDLPTGNRITLEIAAVVAPRPEAEAAEFGCDVLRDLLELRARCGATQHGIVRDDSDAASHVGWRDGMHGLLNRGWCLGRDQREANSQHEDS